MQAPPMDGEEEDPLVEEREAEMVSPTGPTEPIIKRKAWFLKRTATSTHDPIGIGATFCPSRPNSSSRRAQGVPVPEDPFKGWRSPQREWGRWVGKLRPVYEDLWKKAGIFGAIQASTYNIRKDPSLVWGLVSFWCGETNTFHFPWSEATLTLEDVMILGGFPALGEPIRARESLAGELAGIESKMVAECRKFNQTAGKKATHSSWIKHFMEGEGDELEHIAFLSLWLSRYVLPGYPGDTMGHYVFPIAIRLGRGATVALAPAVLAALYRDLRAMKDHLVVGSDGGHEASSPLAIWAPFKLLQLWAWERFVALRPERPNFVDSGEPRTARWCGLGQKTELSFVCSVLESPGEFRWRPYATNLDNWCRPAFYKDNGGCVRVDADRNEELGSFTRCLRACELVGLDCIEQYLPHRVGMQFGFDQDIPGFVSRANSTWEFAWETYAKSPKNAMLYVPSRFFESGVTLEYAVWWKEYMVASTDAGRHITLTSIKKSRRMMMEEKKRKEVCSLPKMKKRKTEVVYNMRLADWIALQSCLISSENKHVKSQKRHTCAMKKHKKLKIHLKRAERIRSSSDASEQGKSEEITQSGEASVSDPLDIADKGIMDDAERMGSGDYAYEPAVLDGTEGILSHPQSQLKLEESEESTRLTGKGSELDLQIRRLKEEIAVIQARLMDMESPNEVHS